MPIIDNNDNYFQGLNITQILSGNCTVCILSIIVNIIEIKIIFSLKFLHSILYRLLFLISISEIINCTIHIVQSILIIFECSVLYKIDTFIIFFTDTFSLILLVCLCDSMNTLIIKQNRKIATNQSYKYFSLIFAFVMTVIFFIFFIINYNDDYIYSNLISWKFLSNENISNIKFFSLNFISYLITIIIYFLLIIYSFYLIIKIQIFIKEKSQDEPKSKNWSKLNEFKLKMIKYPLYGALWVFPLIIYSLFEYINKGKTNLDDAEDRYFLRIKYFLYFAFTFTSSIRGILFFKLFISNEKIKKYIQHKIKNVIFLEKVMDDELSNWSNPSSRDSCNTMEGRGTIFQEGLIDDRDAKEEKNDNIISQIGEDDSDSDDDNISGSQCKSINENKTMPENNNAQSLSSLSESKKEFTSLNNDKKNPLKFSGLSE